MVCGVGLRFKVYNAFGVRSIFRGSQEALAYHPSVHQLGKGDLKAKSGFPDAAGSHPLSYIKESHKPFQFLFGSSVTVVAIVSSSSFSESDPAAALNSFKRVAL